MAKNKQESKLDELDLKEIKDELMTYMRSKVSLEIDKSTKKLIHYKNSIIFRKNITILVLIVICLLLAYNLYSISDIRIDITTDNKGTEVEKKEDSSSILNDDNKDKYKEYNYLFDKILISENSDYIKDYYDGNLSDELKLYLTINNINDDKVNIEDETAYIEKDDLFEVFDSIFDSSFEPKSFKYNNLDIKYLASKEIFFIDGKFSKDKSNVVREIISVEDNDNLVISTVEGVIKSNKLFNVKTGKEIKKYKKNSLINYTDDLTTLVYTFSNVDDQYKLISISNK